MKISKKIVINIAFTSYELNRDPNLLIFLLYMILSLYCVP